jgi:hypothetical protein
VIFGKITGVEIFSPQAKFLIELYEADLDQYLEVARSTPVSMIPELVAAWADDESRVRWEGMGDPANVMVEGEYAGSRFKCENGHFPRSAAGKFLRDGCDVCRRTPPGEKRFVAEEEFAAQWHPDLNGSLTPESVVVKSTKLIWWRTQCCGYEFRQSPINRLPRGNPWEFSRVLCPQCGTVLSSLAYGYPDLAVEWSPNNPATAWQVRAAGRTDFLPEWICSAGHVWTATLSQRLRGMTCPECNEWGKSKVELAHHAAAVEVFGLAESGALLSYDSFVSRGAWRVDISLLFHGGMVVVEYDGVYWHQPADKQEVDRRKSLDLINAGCTVIRLREEGLPTLGIASPRYREFTVSPTEPRPDEVIRAIYDWLDETV